MLSPFMPKPNMKIPGDSAGKDKRAFVPEITLYTDGSFRRPNAASWGYILIDHKTDDVTKVAEPFWDFTINQAELMAVIRGIEAVGPNKKRIMIYSDSLYVVKSINIWIRVWHRAQWKNHEGVPIKNQEYMERLHALKQLHHIRIQHISAHKAKRLEDIDKEKDPHTYYNHQIDEAVQDVTRKMIAEKKA